jgi:cation transport ATPase
MAVNRYWVNRVLLVMTGTAVPMGLFFGALGMPRFATTLWAATTAVTLAPLALSLVQSLRKRALGVDIIALLAMCGALALHEYLAGAVIALMLSGGRSLEDYA